MCDAKAVIYGGLAVPGVGVWQTTGLAPLQAQRRAELTAVFRLAHTLSLGVVPIVEDEWGMVDYHPPEFRALLGMALSKVAGCPVWPLDSVERAGATALIWPHIDAPACAMVEMYVGLLRDGFQLDGYLKWLEASGFGGPRELARVIEAGGLVGA